MCPAALWTAALCLLWCALLTPDADAKVTAVWIDVEDHDVIISGRNSTRDRGWLENATSIAHAAGLRFAADAQVGWALSGNSADPTRPVHEQVMDIVDEITLMDYFTACANVSSAGAVRCDPTQAIYLAAPWVTYGHFLSTTRNRSVLLDIGVAIGSDHGRVQTELELETLLEKLSAVLKGEEGGSQIRNFAVFENSGYREMTETAPCPASAKVCARPIQERPSRAVWWYGLLHERGSPALPNTLNTSNQLEIVSWCQSHHVTELYLDQWSSSNPVIQQNFEDFVLRTDAAGIDLQLYVGEVEDATQHGIPARVAQVASWCDSKPHACGPRPSPRFCSDSSGHPYATRAQASAKCASEHLRLCRKAELKGHSKCEAGWCVDWEGYWMATASKGCGHAGFNSHAGAAGAWCCQP